jgi:hypothetical protein
MLSPISSFHMFTDGLALASARQSFPFPHW